MSLTEREFNLQMILANNRIGPVIPDELLKKNKFFARLSDVGRFLCQKSTDDTVEFRIVDNDGINAAAVYPTKSVVVYRGTLNGVLKIAATIVGKGIFPEVGNMPPPVFEEQALRAVSYRKDIIDSKTDFFLDVESHPWINDSERLALFNFIADTLLSVIVFHEIGHHFNDHGAKNGRGHDCHFDMDEMTGLPEQGSLDKQGLESVADTCGFQMLAEHLDWLLQSRFPDRELDIIRAKFARTGKELLLRCSQIVFVYFFFMETPGWSKRDPMDWHYPPAGFRLTTIYATAMEHGIIGVPNSEFPTILLEALHSTEALLSVAFDLIPDLSWLAEMNNEKYQKHYEKVLKKIAIWSHDGEKKWIPYSAE